MYNIPSKINSFNVYKDGTRLIGISEEVTLPDFGSLTETLSGPGILGEVDDPTLGHFPVWRWRFHLGRWTVICLFCQMIYRQ